MFRPPILFGEHIATSSAFYDHCHKLGNTFVIITDSNVASYYLSSFEKGLEQQGFRCKSFVFPAGEKSKNRRTKAQIEDQMLDARISKDSIVIALGGGVVLDLAGYIAATFLRGLECIYIPTTLLGMVDAAHGGKNGVNTSHGKNLIGSNLLPKCIVIDPLFLHSLPLYEMQNGLAEIIKHGIIWDAKLFDTLVSDRNYTTPSILLRAIEIKYEVMESDSPNTPNRDLLNFGHTVGHALEVAMDYSISHGNAIAIGMMTETLLSKELSKDAQQRVFDLFNDYQFQWKLPQT